MTDYTTRADQVPLLSVIVPMYNVADYIGDCLASLYGQLAADELEIVVVDDAATDGSMDRVTNFLKKFPDAPVRVVRHDENLGLGEARRTGFSASTGEYIWCLDADDLAVPGSLHELADELRHLPKDTILQLRNYEIVDADGASTGRFRPGIRFDSRFIDTREYVRHFLRGEASPNITNKVFPRSPLELDDLSRRRIWEDNPTVIALMSRFSHVWITDMIIYQIRERATSIMRSGTQLGEQRSVLVREVAAEVKNRFGDAFQSELQYYVLNAGVMEDILNVIGREPSSRSAYRRVRSLSTQVDWSSIRLALKLGKYRSAVVAALVKVAPLLSTFLLRWLLEVGPWRR